MAPKAKSKSRARSASAGTASSATAKAKGKARAAGSQAPAPTAKERSPEESAVMRLQSAARGFLARAALDYICAERRRQEADVAEAMRAAERATERKERRRAQAEREKAESKRKKAKQLVEDTNNALEAAYAGETDALERLFSGGLPVDAHNSHGTTPLSEAACGGGLSAVRLLLERKSNPNSQGEFQRTPLWRAAFSGHPHIVTLLLEGGADPRLCDEQCCAPVDIAQSDDVLECLHDWNLARTDELLSDYQSWAEEERLEEDFRKKHALRSVDREFEEAKATHDVAQKFLVLAKVEFRRRQKEHGIGLASGSDVAQQACASALAQVEKAEVEAAAAQRQLDQSTLRRMEAVESLGHKESPHEIGRKVRVQDLNNVLIRDIGARIGQARQWPLIIDPSDLAKKLINYSGSSVLSFWNQEEMQPDRIRVALLSMIRAGGILAVDLFGFAGGVDLALLADPFDQIRPGLFADIVSRDLLDTPKGSLWPKFNDLARKDEKGRFSKEMFDPDRTSRFKFMILTTTDHLNKELSNAFELLCVTLTGDGD